MNLTNTIASTDPTIDQSWDELRSGHKSALEIIYRSYINDLYSFGMSLHADESIVKDAIQDVFIDLWNYREKLSKDVVIKQYLLKSLSNRIQKELGKNARRSSLNWLTDQETSTYSIEEEWINNQTQSELSSKMHSAMRQLPVRQKEVIHYLFFEKMNYEETSKLLDITIRSTYTLAWKAINALKKAIIAVAVFSFII